jgi:hypothetical protein
MKLEEFQPLNESYVSLIGTDDATLEAKRKYAQEVFDLLQLAYASIGGIKGSGFDSPEDMIENIPFWKLNVANEHVRLVLMYKDVGGRKLVATATDGSERAKRQMVDQLIPELDRAYGEKSGPSLGFFMKSVPFEALQPYLRTPDEAAAILNRDVIQYAGYEGELTPGDERTADRFPELREYFYLRDIGGVMKLKLMLGTPGKKIT